MLYFWIGFFTLVSLLLFLDLFVFHRKNDEMSFHQALGWTAFWVALGMSFSGVVYGMYEFGWHGGGTSAHSPQTGFDAIVVYLSAYLLELALSVDNVFVIALLFASFRIPRRYQHRILYWGIMGAIFFRVIMLTGGVYLVRNFDWVFYIFGAYLIYAGVKMMIAKEPDTEHAVEEHLATKILKRFVRIVDGHRDGKFTDIVDGKRVFTTSAVCLVAVELTDVVFALDSVPAVMSISQETFMIVTSNIFAIMGLRSLYFVLDGAMNKFKYLGVALSVLLIFIGVKMCLHHYWKPEHWVSLLVIAAILGAGIIASLTATTQADEASPPPDRPL